MFFTLSREILKYFSQAAQSTYRSKLPLIFRTFSLPSIPPSFLTPQRPFVCCLVFFLVVSIRTGCKGNITFRNCNPYPKFKCTKSQDPTSYQMYVTIHHLLRRNAYVKNKYDFLNKINHTIENPPILSRKTGAQNTITR